MDSIHRILEENGINLLNLTFILLTASIMFFGALMNFFENSLPHVVRQSFRYGKHRYKGRKVSWVNRFEVPKGWFKHFYLFAIALSMLALFLLMKCLVMRSVAPEFVMVFLDFVAGGRANRRVEISSTHALIVIVLMNMQCARRFYETNFVQVFSRQSKINITHYIVGYVHYFGVIIAIVSNSEGFVRGAAPSKFALSNITILQYACISMFHFCWLQQYNSNMILVNLRKNQKTGRVTTEAHLLPTGGFFNYISSPHMFFEMVIYVAVLGIIPQSASWRYICCWVISNQISVGLMTHKWYKETFKNYPKQRRAILPYIL